MNSLPDCNNQENFHVYCICIKAFFLLMLCFVPFCCYNLFFFGFFFCYFFYLREQVWLWSSNSSTVNKKSSSCKTFLLLSFISIYIYDSLIHYMHIIIYKCNSMCNVTDLNFIKYVNCRVKQKNIQEIKKPSRCTCFLKN